MVSPNASSLPGLVYLDLSENELERFKFFFNPGENGVLKVTNGKNSMTLWSWQMIKGDESSRVKGTLYCENSPKIKTQPKPEIAAKPGVPFSVSVEMESTGNYTEINMVMYIHQTLQWSSQEEKRFCMQNRCAGDLNRIRSRIL